MSTTVGRWSVELELTERDGHTHALARLHPGLANPLTATGFAQLSRQDPLDVAEIGYELAAARALQALAQTLLLTARDNVTAITSS
jgi:hypothetical protein